MHKKAKKGVGQSKNFGPIQKLTVPDFQHITNVYEQMQSDILEKPAKARRQMKPFTIRKAAAPTQGQAHPVGGNASVNAGKYSTGPGGDRQNFGSMGELNGDESAGLIPPQEESNLTQEELEALQPKGIRVVNPWIHEQTHKQYLTNITGLPARHANVIKQHKHVIKETAFLPDDDKMVDKDKATREALAILEGEYDIFNDPGMLPVKALPRYDTWDQDKDVQEWLDYCAVRPDQAHALSPSYSDHSYAWKPVKVLGYDWKEKKYMVKVIGTNQEKLVTRLSLLFYAEDPEMFKERVNLCKTRQKNVEAEIRFTQLVDSIPQDAVSVLSKERRESFLKKCISENDKFESSAVYNTFSNLMRVVQEEYIRQMKKCIVMKEMHDPAQFAKFLKLKVPIRLNKKTSPYFGVVRCPKYNFLDYQSEILKIHWCSDPNVADLTRIFSKKCIEFLSKRFMQTDRRFLALPLKLTDMKEAQKEHYESIQKNMKNEWREFLVSEIRRKLREAHNIFESQEDQYLKSQLKRIIVRFELILNSFLREFVHTSINDWVAFIKTFTKPKYEQEELWPLSQTSLLQINLSIIKPQSKSKDDKKKKKKTAEDEDDSGDVKTIQFSPSLQACGEFLTGALQIMQEINNEFNSLEKDLVTFLKYGEVSSFSLTEEFPEDYQWIVDARQQLTAMIDENVVEPEALLAKYKKYEYILNVNKKDFVNNLFKRKVVEEDDEPKASIEEIQEALTKFDQAEQEILAISNDVINYPFFRVMAGDLKQKLSEQANSIKTKILEGCEKWCRNTVSGIEQTYVEMSTRIKNPPANEMELVELNDFIDKSKNETKQAQEDLLKEVERHHILMDEFSYMYQDMDIEMALGMKCWPSQIQETINDGKEEITLKTEMMVNKLDADKDEFGKNMTSYKDIFKQIKTFSSIDEVNPFAKDAINLDTAIKDCAILVEQFNLRETRLGQPNTQYPDLDTIRTDFLPFFELLDTAYQSMSCLQDYQQSPLINQEYDKMEEDVTKWHMTFFKLQKKLNEDYGEASDVAGELKKKIEEFRENLPLIKCIMSEAIHAEDWDEIKKVTNRPELERDTLTVIKFESEKLMDFLPEIEDITNRAEKKFQLTKKLQALKVEMKEFKMTTFQYKDTYVLKAYDEVNAKLDDQMVAVQAMLGSSYMRGRLKPETKLWETKLNNMSELVEEIGKCQKVWMQLEPVFASDDIGKTLAHETSLFKDVDLLWKNTMTQIVEDPGILDLVERDNIFQQFQNSNKYLDKITKSLNDYLEEKRLIFPRFYFLANEDLLMLLAQTKDPTLVQPHMEKCFEGINRVKFKGGKKEEKVCGMISAEKEEVPMLKDIDVNEGEKKGNVEKWMLEIEIVMRKTLQELVKASLKDFYQIKRIDWVQKWAGQIVLAVDSIDWTTGVEETFKQNAPNGLKNYNQTLKEQMLDIVALVRGELPTGTRTTLKALVVIAQHSIYVVDELINKEVETKDEFEWGSQLRYYYTEKTMHLEARMVTAVVPYGFEYLGNSLRLVITPLTDRCYRTLMGAKNLNYGGAPEGPAGTGKTESVKDLAKALAVQCVVFNCQDGLDHNAMAKFFKGLASSGAWCCFDEFNRIDLEVLSVIAQQILTIQHAIVAKQKMFLFEGTNLGLNPQCAINITMNPGYAGRAELPDNLKALFRPCAMMVPDYALIGEIELYSFGFAAASKLAVKVVASLRLSSEQLSSQDHYDFGMRALKAILTACGNLRRKLDMDIWTEDQIGLRALQDVNLPKFTSNDIPLYTGITSDLFPGIQLHPPDYSVLMDAMTAVCAQNNLQPKDDFLKKCIQLYETAMVRHGLMVVGHAFSGKSKVIDVLAQAFGTIKDNPEFVAVNKFYMNPKSLKLTQLYGVFDEDTGEWTDGILAITIRNCAQSETPERKWIIFDGPVDAIWIENMNTVLDDNKKLCLASGQIIKLKPVMNIMFEVDDLSVASPATISRCGMVLLEPKQLGYNVLITSYCNEIAEWVDRKICDQLHDIFQYMCDVTVEFTRQNCKFPVPTGPNFHVQNMLKVFDSFVRPWKAKADDEEHKIPKEAEAICMNAVLFAFLWGYGAQIDEASREKYDLYLQDVLAGENVIEKYKIQDVDTEMEIKTLKTKVGSEFTSLFELSFEPEDLKWINWIKTIPAYHVPGQVKYSEVIVPTQDSIRVNAMINRLLINKSHVLLCGPTGTGKSISVLNEMATKFENENYTYIGLAFSAQTSANQTQLIIDGKMEKKRKGIYGPPLGKECIIFVDDLSMPQKEKYGAQPPIELLRQWMDYSGWYDIDTPEKEFRKTVNSTFAAAMLPPVGTASISNRYIRHFNVLYIPPYSDDSLQSIFSNVMQWILVNQNEKFPYSEGIKSLKENLVRSTIQVFQSTNINFRPTPAKSHYTYNLRDVSKVFAGINNSNPKAIRDEDDMIKLWSHECMRIFHDRLISNEDREKWVDILKSKIKEKFKKDWAKIVTVEPLLFGNFVPTIYPDNDESKKPYGELYCELTNRASMKKICDDALEDFNVMNRAKKMDLVLFTDAIEHIIKINRVITTEGGHALLVGVGGSGRKSLTQLAVFISTFQIIELEMPKGYDFTMWRADMRDTLFIPCGTEATPVVFLFSDTQIINETFVEDINNILNNGKIPNLYNPEDIVTIIENIKEEKKHDPEFKEIAEDNIAVLQYFDETAKSCLHLVLAMSPIGDDFKRRLRMFPALVNCCTIDWFLAWPKDALQSVAQTFLERIDDLPQLDGIVQICVDMQERVHQLSIKYREELRKYYYVTPTSYLILIKTFSTFLDEKRKKNDKEIYKFDRGLIQLASAASQVADLQAKLEELIPLVKRQAEEAAVKQKEIEITKVTVDKERAECAVQEADAKEQKASAQFIADDCQGALDKVMPIYHSAIRAVEQLKNSDVTELSAFQQATPPVALVAKALCIFKGVQPIKIPPATAKEEVKYEYWKPCKQKVLNGQLLAFLKNYKKDEMDIKLVEQVRPILDEPEFTDERLKNASKAGRGIGSWVRAIIQYYDAMLIVNPKKEELKIAEGKAADAQAVWDSALARLQKVEAEMQQLVDELNETVAKEKQLRKDKDTYENKVDLANTLINSLKSERESWDKSLVAAREFKGNLVGDVLICSGILAYLGVFIKSYRTECVKTWAGMMDTFKIQSSPDVSFVNILGDQVRISEWYSQGLPQDEFSTENAIMMENSERWSLMIDPQMQANLWLKQKHKTKDDQLKVIKPNMPQANIVRILETSITYGNPVIFEDAIETFDPMLDPLLGKQVEKQGKDSVIRFGEKKITFSDDFQFYVTTKMSSPHYSPEICVKVTMLNFMVTADGLLDQMLNEIIRIEEPAKYDRRKVCIQMKAENTKKIAEIQDQILNAIASTGPDILEDTSLKEVLEQSKESQAQIEIANNDTMTTMKQIEKIRDENVPVALRVSRLFFVLTDLTTVSDMYQYSLEFFKNVFEGAVRSAEAAGLEKNARKEKRKYWIQEFTKRLYDNVARSLFQKHVLLFSFLICLKIKDELLLPQGSNQLELRFFLAGSTQVELTKPNPTGEGGWLTDKSWLGILEMSSKFETFRGLDESFIKDNKLWEKIFESSRPESFKENPWPQPWNDLELIQKINIMRAFRPDKVIQMVQKIVKKQPELGQAYLQPPSFSMEDLFNDSTNKSPIIIVISPGADPMTEINNFSKKKKIAFESLSLGKGQAKKAINGITKAQTEPTQIQTIGTFVVLQNCHLAVSFMPTLDRMIEEIVIQADSTFRLWLTTEPTDKFPVTIVQNSIKATSEPPKGLKQNMLKSYKSISDKEFAECTKPIAFRRLLWGLCFFNAIILERRKFGPLGWNIAYSFSASDFRISTLQLIEFLNFYDEVPYEALIYMVAEANYGGRVTDTHDRITIDVILKDYYNSMMINEENHKLSPSGKYYVPGDGARLEYIDFINENVPINDLTEIFSMHDNAEITSAINQTNDILETALTLQPRASGEAGKSQDEIANEIAIEILQKLPKDFDMEDAARKHPIKYEDSMNTVLQQEILRFSRLLQLVRQSLVNIGKAIKGEVVMSPELEQVALFLFNNRVPAVWMQRSYPSLKPLASYVVDFLERLKFIQGWIDGQAPAQMWISGFFFTQSFLTGLKQNYARKHIIAIDRIDFDFEVIDDDTKYDQSVMAPDGAFIFGLFLEGCKWDKEQHVLAESDPKVLFTKMPNIWLKPSIRDEIPEGHTYMTPVYKTLARFGVLSTTGHSTNFVVTMKLNMMQKHQSSWWTKRGVAMITQLSD